MRLQMPLHAHEVEPAQELGVLRADIDARGAARRRETARPSHARARAATRRSNPAAARRGRTSQARTPRPENRECRDSLRGARRRRPSDCASDSRDARTPAAAASASATSTSKCRASAPRSSPRQRQAQMTAAEPLWKQPHLPSQQRVVIRRQLRRVLRARSTWMRTSASMASRYSRSASPPASSSIRYVREPRSELSRKPCAQVALEHARRVDADVDQHGRDADVGLHVLLVGRRIHGDPGLRRRASRGNSDGSSRRPRRCVIAKSRVPNSRASQRSSCSSRRSLRGRLPCVDGEDDTLNRCSLVDGQSTRFRQSPADARTAVPLIIIAADAGPRTDNSHAFARVRALTAAHASRSQAPAAAAKCPAADCRRPAPRSARPPDSPCRPRCRHADRVRGRRPRGDARRRMLLKGEVSSRRANAPQDPRRDVRPPGRRASRSTMASSTPTRT